MKQRDWRNSTAVSVSDPLFPSIGHKASIITSYLDAVLRACCSYQPLREVSTQSMSNVVLAHLHVQKSTYRCNSKQWNMHATDFTACVSNIPLVAYCQEEPFCQEHTGNGYCTLESTTPDVHQKPLHLCHSGSRGTVEHWMDSFHLAGAAQWLVVLQVMAGRVVVNRTHFHIRQVFWIIWDTIETGC